MGWQTVLADLQGHPLGELREASGRSFRRFLNRPRTASWTIGVDNPLARYHLDADLTLAKVYENHVLRFVGPVMAFEKARDSSNGTIQVTAADAFAARLPHRLLGKSATGATYATAGAQQDKGALAALMLADANATGDTGIRIGSIEASTTGYAGPYWYQPADQAISDLSAGLGGFDWDLVPVEPATDSSGVQLGRLDIFAAKGATLDDVVFEFGTGKHNVASFRHVGDASGLGNQAYSLPPGFPDNATQAVVTATDAASIAERGIHEIVVAGDLQVDALRQALVDQNVAVRKRPRQVITFEPIAEDPVETALAERRVPRAFVDYDVGDVIRFRAREQFKVIDPVTGSVYDMQPLTTVDALFRVFGIDMAIDDSGQATPSLTLVLDGS